MPQKSVLFNSSFQAVFFADSRRKRGFQPVKSLDFCIEQHKKENHLKRTSKQNHYFGTRKLAYSPPANLSGSSTNILITPALNKAKGYVTHFRKNYHSLLLGNWNVFAFKGKKLKLARDAKKYYFNIVLSFFTKRCGSGIRDLDSG